MTTSEKDRKLIEEAKKRFKRCEEFEANFRSLYIEDVKFAHGDSDNMWQWSDAMVKSRRADSRPSLTVNKTRQHNLMIVNDAKMNKPSVKFIPTGGAATYESAQVCDGIMRHIEYQSNAQDSYDYALECAVEGGIGYWRVATDYLDEESFDQEIFIRRIKDPMSVYLDPDICEQDGSDAEFCLLYEDLPTEEFNRLYPEYADKIKNEAPFFRDGWVKEDCVRVCEYFYKEYKKDTLVGLPDGSMVLLSQIEDENVRALLKADDDTPKRKLDTVKVKWCKFAGNDIIEKADWAGKYIPIVRVVGEEVVVNGELDRKGHTRYMKDPQRMYNYWTSAGVEFVALQSKIPYVAPVKAIQGFENYWKTANLMNHAYLPYNHADEESGESIPAPTRQTAPIQSQGIMQGLQIASEEIKMASGQYDNSMGRAENETSGVAIMQRQRQGDKATYQFIDNLAKAIRFTGKIIIDLIPKIYDTPRIVRTLAEDGEQGTVKIDPQSGQPLQEQESGENKVERIFNPGLGKYDVEAAVGPSYQTRRQEAFAALSQIIGQNAQLTQVCGDLMFKAADFPMADELAERIARTIPDAIKGEGPTPEVEQMGMQLQQQQALIENLMNELSAKEQDKAVNVYKAETDRMKAVGENISPEAMAVMVAQLVAQSLQTQLVSNSGANATPEAMSGAITPDMQVQYV